MFRWPKSANVTNFICNGKATFNLNDSFNFLFRPARGAICNIRGILLSSRLLTITNNCRDYFIACVNGIYPQRSKDLTYRGICVRAVICLSKTRICARCFLALVGIK